MDTNNAEETFARFRKHSPAMVDLAKRYRDDAAFRSRIDSGDTADVLGEVGLSIPPGIETRLAVNTPETFYFVLPPDPNTGISEETLSAISAGGKGGGTISSAGCTAATASTATTTAGTASTFSSGGCAWLPGG